MSISRKRLMVAGAAGVLTVGIMATPALADTQGQSQGITGGSLSETSAALSFTTAQLTGATFNSNSSSSPWTVVNPTGTDNEWSLSVSSPDLTSAAGSTEDTARTIPATQLSYASNTVTAGTDADAVSTNFSVGNSSTFLPLEGPATAKVVITASAAKGTYTFTPTARISVKANQYRANHTTGSTGAYNPYTGTLTMTIA